MQSLPLCSVQKIHAVWSFYIWTTLAQTICCASPHAFLVLHTSPGNFQAWLAVKEAPEDFARRLCQGAGEDPTASGATRISGSVNFKTKYAPEFPRVEFRQVNAGKVTTTAELDRVGVVAPQEESHPPRPVSNLRQLRTFADQCSDRTMSPMDSNAILTGILSGGLTSVVISAIWNHFSNLWLQRHEAGLKAKLATLEDDFQRSQRQVQAEIDRSVFVTRAHFETEFEAMKQVFSCLSEVRLAINGLRPLSQLIQRRASCPRSRRIIKGRPFEVGFECDPGLYRKEHP